MKTERFRFPNFNGNFLSANMDTPDNGEFKAIAIYAHCFTCSKNLKTLLPFFKSLTEESVAIFRFDFTGIGLSEGHFTETTFSHNIQDILSAAQYIEDTFEAPKLLIGHSLGASAVLVAANKIESIKAVVTIAAASSPTHLGTLLNKAKTRAEKEGQAKVKIGEQIFTLNSHFFQDLEEQKMDEIITSLSRPLLVLHSPLDQTVPIEHAAKIIETAKHPKSFVSLHPADHLLSDSADSRHAGKIIAGWASKYIES
jgi:alpha/beta superfamily hydrolase